MNPETRGLMQVVQRSTGVRSALVAALRLRKASGAVCVTLVLSVAVDTSLAATRYVKVGGSASGDCAASWSNTCTLAHALSQAQVGDEVWVQAGTHAPFSLVNGVKVIGGFAGTETSASQSDPVANETIVDGGGGRAVTSDNDGPSTVLRGFMIQNGGDTSYDGGGGMLLTASSAVIVQCVFRNNTATWWGGAVSIREASSPHFVNCTFHDNGHPEWASPYPGCVSDPDVECPETIAGAAVYVHDGSPTFANCLFYNNKSGEGGVLANNAGTPTLINSTMASNQATIKNGGAIHDEAGQTVIRNAILWNNSAAEDGHQIYSPGSASTTVTYSDVQGGWSGTGNSSSDPLFVDSGSNEYQLQSTSPCRNTGRNSDLPFDDGDLDWDGTTAETLPLDLASIGRKIGTVDKGAYEYAECQNDAQCAGDDVCCNYACVECCTDADCTGMFATRCKLSTHTCVQCLTDADCSVGCCKWDSQCGQCGGGGFDPPE